MINNILEKVFELVDSLQEKVFELVDSFQKKLFELVDEIQKALLFFYVEPVYFSVLYNLLESNSRRHRLSYVPLQCLLLFFQGLFLCLLLFFQGLFLLLCFVSQYNHFPLAVFSRFSLSSWTKFLPISSFYSDTCRIKTRSIYTLVSREKCSTVLETYSSSL